jgi:hypothetical protein
MWIQGEPPSGAESTDPRERFWPTRCVGDHWELIDRLRRAIGRGNFQLEMRNNVYRVIVTDPAADMDKVDQVGEASRRTFELNRCVTLTCPRPGWATNKHTRCC